MSKPKPNWKSLSRSRLATLLAFAACAGIQPATADSITIAGNLSSDRAAVSSADPVIVDPTTINVGDPFSILLTYNPASSTHSGNSFVLNDASLTLSFDAYSFAYSAVAGNFIEFSTPGAFGLGTASFFICSSLANCSITDFITLYFSGTITDLNSLASQVGGLTGDAGASPSEFEFLRNFDDGSQTDLQGTLIGGGAASGVPEPATAALCTISFCVSLGCSPMAARCFPIARIPKERKNLDD